MNKTKQLLICLTSVIWIQANALQQASSVTDVNPKLGWNEKLPTTIHAPFWFSWKLEPLNAQNYSVCAIVELVGDANRVKKAARIAGGKSTSAPLIEFDVKIIDGSGIPKGSLRHCFAPDARPASVLSTKNRFLLLGWQNYSSDRLGVWWYGLNSPNNGNALGDIQVKGECLFVGAMLPTKLATVLTGGSFAGRAYINLAQTWILGAEPSVLRATTSEIATINLAYAKVRIEGLQAHDWLGKNLGPVLLKASVTNPVDKLRLEGFLADWMKPKSTMDYIRSLPSRFIALNNKQDTPSSGDRLSDLQFVRTIDLCYGMDPNEIIAIGLSDPMLKFLALDGRYGIPSIETQQKMLCLLDDMDIGIRATAYRRFANWYRMLDWSVNSVPTSSPSGHGEEIPNEQEMHDYWIKKLGGPIRP